MRAVRALRDGEGVGKREHAPYMGARYVYISVG